MPIARVNGIDLNYRLDGDGEETIVLVNGLADDLETWAYQAGDFLAVTPASGSTPPNSTRPS